MNKKILILTHFGACLLGALIGIGVGKFLTERALKEEYILESEAKCQMEHQIEMSEDIVKGSEEGLENPYIGEDVSTEIGEMWTKMTSVYQPVKVNYNNYNKARFGDIIEKEGYLTDSVDMRELEQPYYEDDEVDEEPLDDDILEEGYEEYEDKAFADRKLLPYLISERQYIDEKPHYDKENLRWYYVDDVVTDDGDVLDSEDISKYVGWDCFHKLENEKIVWVRNELFEADYEICRLDKAYDGGD